MSNKMHYESKFLANIIGNFEVPQSTCEEAMSVIRDTDYKARISGVAAQIKTFNFINGVMLAEMILRHADDLSNTLQHESLSAAGQQLAQSLYRHSGGYP